MWWQDDLHGSQVRRFLKVHMWTASNMFAPNRIFIMASSDAEHDKLGWAVCLKRWKQTHAELFHSGAGSSGTAVPTHFLFQGDTNMLSISAKVENKVTFFRWDYITRTKKKKAWKCGKLGWRSKGHFSLFSLSSLAPFPRPRLPRVGLRGKRETRRRLQEVGLQKCRAHLCSCVCAWMIKAYSVHERGKTVTRAEIPCIYFCVRQRVCVIKAHAQRGFW